MKNCQKIDWTITQLQVPNPEVYPKRDKKVTVLAIEQYETKVRLCP